MMRECPAVAAQPMSIPKRIVDQSGGIQKNGRRAERTRTPMTAERGQCAVDGACLSGDDDGARPT
jgi:hypothetical protein